MKKVFFILPLLFFTLYGCISLDSGSSITDEATSACILKCQSMMASEDYSSGPCLSNEVKPDWVCDVAHNPRHVDDNKPENQCTAFREGRAHHFVEVDEKCHVIKVV